MTMMMYLACFRFSNYSKSNGRAFISHTCYFRLAAQSFWPCCVLSTQVWGSGVAERDGNTGQRARDQRAESGVRTLHEVNGKYIVKCSSTHGYTQGHPLCIHSELLWLPKTLPVDEII